MKRFYRILLLLVLFVCGAALIIMVSTPTNTSSLLERTFHDEQWGAAAATSDTLPPSLTPAYPSHGETVTSESIEVRGIAFDESGIHYVKVNDILAEGTTNWSAFVHLSPGSNEITIVATDGAQRSTTRKITVTYIPPPPPTPPPRIYQMGELRTLVFLVNTASSPPGATKDQIHTAIFNGPFSNWLKEVSYGKTWVTGTTLDWVSAELSNPSACTFTHKHPLFNDTIIKNNVNLSTYKHVIILVRGGSGGCSGAQIITQGQYNPRVSTVGMADDLYYTNPTFQNFHTHAAHVLLHEFGHGLGLPHAQSKDCTTVVVSNTCSVTEYGNIFDPMGGGALGLHFNARYKELLGWIDQPEILSIRQSGRYTINSLEQSGGMRAAKIYLSNGQQSPFYIEARRGTGFNAVMKTVQIPTLLGGKVAFPGTHNPDAASNEQGIFVNFSPSSGAPAQLLDMSPTPNLGWIEDLQRATLNIGAGSFTDPETGITIGPVISTTPTSVTFDITIPNSQTGEMVYHPADAEKDSRLTLNEVARYALAWKQGGVWHTSPHPIPIGYIGNAVLLWKQGELYQHNSTLPCPSCWQKK